MVHKNILTEYWGYFWGVYPFVHYNVSIILLD